MLAGSTLITDFLLPFAVLVAAGSTSASAAIAWKLYQAVKTHDRALFGEDAVDGHDGIIQSVNENTRMTDEHRRVLRKHELIDSSPTSEPENKHGN